MVSVCTGALLLAHAGVIGDRRCTTHTSARSDLASTGATVIDARVVDDGDLITGAGVTSGLDIGLHLVRRFIGDDAAAEAARRAEYWPG
jgi:transcriptional regulator GlxA family with amidase domain